VLYLTTLKKSSKRHRTGIRRGQRGQSLVEFAISSIVLLLLMMGLLDLSRAFYYAVNMQGDCLAGADGNTINNKPYASSAYPASTQQVNVYICYTQPGGAQVGTLAAHPTDNSWRLGDVNVALLMNFGLITPFIQNIFGNGVPVVYNEHFTIQGKP